jgi:uncharacterized membrane protein
VAVLWDGGTATPLETPAGSESVAYGANRSGDVVGAVIGTFTGFRPALWRGGKLIGLSTTGGSSGTARSINDAGDIAGAATTVGAPIDQAFRTQAKPNPSMSWQLINAGDRTGILLRNLHSRLCLHIAGGSTANGARADQALCNLGGGDHAMVWRRTFSFSEDGVGVLLQSVHSNRCLHVVAASQATGARLEQVSCVAGDRDHAQV